ncbi:hypothetical protein GobsT_21190 [Gemmata obscuriglobus]|uniref:hypothetical protein n=1 Tax=Gemmata obscuriglobus TaxID=114 RepID=UPI00016C4BA4|nr:hypothetical protein [Gemmata obscuriglobus]QEG27365.1 hypothetical protein GobsT_21190 [Gemmata obscuriglobus]VTS04245.1 Uncharacterized protein OS=Sorangium cellulosum (strain So ce56) GN=sce5710 PE=4 SV=1 [Gemmata obscuriglobus UQM 2246]
MTEEEWLACNDPGALIPLSWERNQKRKVRLFGCACCRRIWELLIHPTSRSAVEIAERYAEGNAERSELDRAAEGARRASELAHNGGEPFSSLVYARPGAYESAAHAAYTLARPSRPAGWPLMRETAEAASDAAGRVTERAEQIALVRDIFGNPFRPISLAPEWRTPTAVALALRMYDARNFDAMPILADALQDAGCENGDILNHCRGNQPHVRGCWVVDLILGKG